MTDTMDNRSRDRRFYDATAHLYDLTEFFRKPTREAMVRASGCQAGDLVLDICSGTCELARTFGQHGIFAVAVDLSMKMLRVGKRKTCPRELAFLQTDALRLPFKEKTFDAVVVSLALHHMPEVMQIEVMREMTRLSRNRVVMVEYHSPRNPRWQTAKGYLVQLMDESRLLQNWMHQDFSETCRQAGLLVLWEEVLTLGFHRITVCQSL